MKITISELKRMVQEEMMNETKRENKRIPTAKEIKNRREKTFGNVISATSAALLAIFSLSTLISDSNINETFMNGYNGKHISEACINSYRQKNFHNMNDQNLLVCGGFFHGIKNESRGALNKALEENLNIGVIDSVISSFNQVIEERVKLNIGPEVNILMTQALSVDKKDLKESVNSNPTKITLSELKQLIRSELKRSGLV